ncbi:MAG: glycoside hydrolase family 18 protein [Nanobdellota archaeon]
MDFEKTTGLEDFLKKTNKKTVSSFKKETRPLLDAFEWKRAGKSALKGILALGTSSLYNGTRLVAHNVRGAGAAGEYIHKHIPSTKKKIGFGASLISATLLSYGLSHFNELTQPTPFQQLDSHLEIIASTDSDKRLKDDTKTFVVNDGEKIHFNMEYASKTLELTDSVLLDYQLVKGLQRIDLGERKIPANTPIYGFFERNDDLENTVSEAQINPLLEGRPNKSYSFLVTVSKDDSTLAKTYLENTHRYKFSFPEQNVSTTTDNTSSLLSRCIDFGSELFDVHKKQVFYYKQQFTDTAIDKSSLEVADYFHPHFFDVQSGDDAYILISRGADLIESYDQKCSATNTKHLPMISIFHKDAFLDVYANKTAFAQQLADYETQFDLDGFALDIESTSLKKDHSDKLVEVVKEVNEHINGELVVATSAKYTDETASYPHHAFYDIGELEPHVDYVHMMGYDYNYTQAGPSVRNVDEIVSYFKQELDDDSKFVWLSPGYGKSFYKSSHKPQGTISFRNLDVFTSRTDKPMEYVGEKYPFDLKIYSYLKDRTPVVVYAQNRTTINNVRDFLDSQDITNHGLWRTSNITLGVNEDAKKWKYSLE